MSTFTKAKIKDSEREKWAKVFVVDMMSSEESDMENEENIIVKTLPFRHARVSSYFKAIDEASDKQKTPQALRQRKRRILGGESDRSVPTNLPKWAVIGESTV